jgi:hypothetical protein
MLKRTGLLVAALMVALVPYFEHLKDSGYSDMFSPEHMALLLPIVGGVLLSWLGQSPIQNWHDGRTIK